VQGEMLSVGERNRMSRIMGGRMSRVGLRCGGAGNQESAKRGESGFHVCSGW
jgi:hypothetical protein